MNACVTEITSISLTSNLTLLPHIIPSRSVERRHSDDEPQKSYDPTLVPPHSAHQSPFKQQQLRQQATVLQVHQTADIVSQ